MRNYTTLRKPQRRRNPARSQSLVLGFLCFLVGYLVSSLYDAQHLFAFIADQAIPKTKQQTQAKMQADVVLPKPKLEFYSLLSKDKSEALPEHDRYVIPASAVTEEPEVVQAKPEAVAELKPEQAAPLELEVKKEIKAVESSRKPAEPRVKPQLAAKPVKLPPPVLKPKPETKSPVQPQTRMPNEPYWLQAAAFNLRKDAEQLKARLALRGHPVRVTSFAKQGRLWYRVILGPYTNLAEASRVKNELARQQRIYAMLRKARTAG